MSINPMIIECSNGVFLARAAFMHHSGLKQYTFLKALISAMWIQLEPRLVQAPSMRLYTVWHGMELGCGADGAVCLGGVG